MIIQNQSKRQLLMIDCGSSDATNKYINKTIKEDEKKMKTEVKLLLLGRLENSVKVQFSNRSVLFMHRGLILLNERHTDQSYLPVNKYFPDYMDPNDDFKTATQT
ncbi:guanine nucleotide binding protein, alpha subunit [Gigaspora margarita]|uniref:Guanine nucleotide binding protein, alpha subunit n=1 Tax=Gigaspora margarita TaxID=4874 RepID=A0A8H3XAQ2_GIGMA|nr:guanine nucleotide binding protein, alpha subunit [Gigaspora margarita]